MTVTRIFMLNGPYSPPTTFSPQIVSTFETVRKTYTRNLWTKDRQSDLTTFWHALCNSGVYFVSTKWLEWSHYSTWLCKDPIVPVNKLLNSVWIFAWSQIGCITCSDCIRYIWVTWCLLLHCFLPPVGGYTLRNRDEPKNLDHSGLSYLRTKYKLCSCLRCISWGKVSLLEWSYFV